MKIKIFTTQFKMMNLTYLKKIKRIFEYPKCTIINNLSNGSFLVTNDCQIFSI